MINEIIEYNKAFVARKGYNQKKVLSFFQNWTPKAVRTE